MEIEFEAIEPGDLRTDTFGAEFRWEVFVVLAELLDVGSGNRMDDEVVNYRIEAASRLIAAV